MDRADFWVENFWLPIVVGVVLLVLGASFSKTVRERAWRPLWQLLRTVASVRVTTTGREAREAALRQEAADALLARHGRELDEANARAASEQAEAARARHQAVETISSMQRAIDRTRQLADEEARKQSRAHERLVQRALAQGRAEGRAECEQEVAGQRAALVVRPVWRVQQLELGGDRPVFSLVNVQPDVGELSDVWIEPRLSTFLFDGRSQWPGPWAGNALISGERTGAGRSLDVTFQVHYRDANGDWRKGEAVLAAPPRLPVGPKAASVSPDDPLGPLPRHF